MHQDQRRRTDFQGALKNGAGVERDFRHRPRGRCFVAQQMVAGIKIKDMKAFVRLVGQPTMQIGLKRLRRREDRPLDQRTAQCLELHAPDTDQQIGDAGTSACLGLGLGAGSEHVGKRAEMLEQSVRPARAQRWVEDLEKRLQDGSAPCLRSRERCCQVAAASSMSIGYAHNVWAFQ